MHNFPLCSIPILSPACPKDFGRIQCLRNRQAWALGGHEPCCSQLIGQPLINTGTFSLIWSYVLSHIQITWPSRPPCRPSLCVSHNPGARRGVETQECLSPHSPHSREENNHQCSQVKGSYGSLHPCSGAQGAAHFLLGWEESAYDRFSGRPMQRPY